MAPRRYTPCLPSADWHAMTSTTIKVQSVRRQGEAWQRLISILVRRCLTVLVALTALVVVSFLLLHLVPGDPAARVVGLNAAPGRVAAVRHQLGLDEPLATQFVHYVSRLGHLDFGTSYQTGEPIAHLVRERLPETLRLVGLVILETMLISTFAGLLFGALTREGRHRRVEGAFTVVTSVLGAVPEYVIGTVLVVVFGVSLRWFPIAGGAGLSALVLPSVAIAAGPIAILSRIIRVETLQVLAQDYVRTAYSKRLTTTRIYLRHVLPNAASGALTVGALLFTSLLGGTVIVENVFALPGLGSSLVQAVVGRDYPVVQAIILVLGLAVLILNILVESLVGMLDPQSALGERR